VLVIAVTYNYKVLRNCTVENYELKESNAKISGAVYRIRWWI
jgi:hypothetical protein